MKIAIRYQSRTGNNKTLAQTIGKALSIKPEPISTPLEEKVDILFLGGAVYGMQLDPSLENFLNHLDPKKISAIAPFACVGLIALPISRIKKAAKQKGIKVLKPAPIIRLGFSHTAKPSPQKLEAIAAYAKKNTK